MKKATEWKKIFANYVSDKKCVCRLYKELFNSRIKRQIFHCKMGEDFEQIHPEEA